MWIEHFLILIVIIVILIVMVENFGSAKTCRMLDASDRGVYSKCLFSRPDESINIYISPTKTQELTLSILVSFGYTKASEIFVLTVKRTKERDRPSLINSKSKFLLFET